MDEDALLRGQVELLVRPSGGSVVAGPAEEWVRGDTGSGTGRIGKDEVTGVARLREVTGQAAAVAGLPLLLSVNQEGGRLNAVDWAGVELLPGSLALGAAADEGLAEAAGAAIGGQLRAVGLRWNLAPVCDLAGWPSAAAVGTRSFGCDPQLVGRLAAGFVRGVQAAGVAATAKHFPGLGDAGGDPHLVVPVADRLAAGALVPFQAAVDAGVAAVMVGSHVVAELDDRPAVLSPRVIGLLRDQLGFDGVVVSENLSIPAVHEPVGGLARAAVAAVAAGVDVVMLDSEVSRGRSSYPARSAAARVRAEVVAALVAAVADGLVDRGQVRSAAGRVRGLHRRFGIGRAQAAAADWDQVNRLAGITADRVAARAVTVLRGAELLPLVPAAGSVVGAVRVPDASGLRADSARHAPDLFPAALRAWHPGVVQLRPGQDAVQAGTAAVVVYGYHTGPDSTPGPGGWSGASAEAARLSGRGVPVVQVAFGVIDDLAGSPAEVLVAGYCPHRASVTAVAGTLFGHGRAPGVLPLRDPAW
jgi:beta-N-acetylhexosaminidase